MLLVVRTVAETFTELLPKNSVPFHIDLKKTQKTEAFLAHLSCVKLKLKLDLHSLRRGPVTKAVNAGVWILE